MLKEYLLQELQKDYTLQKRDLGDYAKINKFILGFENEAWHVEGVGNLFAMKMKAMFGLMEMETMVLSPEDKDLSFLSCDAIHAVDTDTVIMEMDRSALHEEDLSAFEPLKEKYAYLPDYQAEPRWYDSFHLSSTICKKGKKMTADMEKFGREYIDTYLKALKEAAPCDPQAKREATAVYAQRLIKEGGVAVDGMTKMIGANRTEKLVAEYMFHIR